MIRIKYLFYILILTVLLGFSLNTFAQDTDKKPKKTPEEIAKKRTDKLNEIVNLDQTQYDQVYNLFVDFVKKAQETRQLYGKDRKSFRDAMKEPRTNLRGQMKTILTDDQKSKLKEHHKIMKQKGMEKRKDKQFRKENREKIPQNQ